LRARHFLFSSFYILKPLKIVIYENIILRGRVGARKLPKKVSPINWMTLLTQFRVVFNRTLYQCHFADDRGCDILYYFLDTLPTIFWTHCRQFFGHIVDNFWTHCRQFLDTWGWGLIYVRKRARNPNILCATVVKQKRIWTGFKAEVKQIILAYKVY